MSEAASECTIDGWDEHAYHSGPNGGKLTRANVKLTLSGDIEGHAEVQWLMCYRPDSTADFVGLQHVTGRVGERSGTIVLETRGTFDGQGATAPCASSPAPAPTSSVASPETVNSARRTGTKHRSRSPIASSNGKQKSDRALSQAAQMGACPRTTEPVHPVART